MKIDDIESAPSYPHVFASMRRESKLGDWRGITEKPFDSIRAKLMEQLEGRRRFEQAASGKSLYWDKFFFEEEQDAECYQVSVEAKLCEEDIRDAFVTPYGRRYAYAEIQGRAQQEQPGRWQKVRHPCDKVNPTDDIGFLEAFHLQSRGEI